MIASLKSISDILGKPDTQYLIPVFQRVYSWDRMQCEQLWNDMMKADSGADGHFTGTFIYRPESSEGYDDSGALSGYTKVDLIDGQQRLTTLTLMLVALRDAMRDAGDAARANQIDETYLHCVTDTSKLVLSDADAPTMAHLVDGAPAPGEDDLSQLLIEGYELFKEKVEESSADADAVIKGLDSLRVVAVELEEDDAPQQVFESLNAKGRPLSTIDLLRNVIMAKYGATEQRRLFDVYWAPIDEAFHQFGAEQDVYLDAALHAWAEKHAPGIRASKRSELYQAFKAYLGGHDSISLEELLRSINESCLAFAAAPGSPEAKKHLDWAVEKPQGLISQSKLFGD